MFASVASRRVTLLVLLTAGMILTTLPLARAQTVFTLNTLYTFTGGSDQGGPAGDLTLGADGNFYGATRAGEKGNGTIFQLGPTGEFTTLYSFDGKSATDPSGAPVQGSDGNLYGVTFGGGKGPGGGSGTVYQLTPAGVVTVLHSFDGSDGDSPQGELALGPDGNFYGTTYDGGANDAGTVFRITSGGRFASLYSFTNGTDAGFPTSGLVLGPDGNFYGTTAGDSIATFGSVFQITPTGTLTTLHAFTGSDGSFPDAKLALAPDGNFYGTTYTGGASGYGTVFRVSPGGVFASLYSFTNADDGRGPSAALALGADGNLYGTTALNVTNNDGTVFQVTPNGAVTTIFRFPVNLEASFPGGLTLGADGSFYGTTQYGQYGSGYGTIFKLTPTAGQPVITSAPVATGYPGLAFSYQITASNAPTSYSAAGLPSPLSFDPATGLITGTPTQLGTYSVSLSAANSVGTGPAAPLTLTITNPPPAPVITSALSIEVEYDYYLNEVNVSYQITATNNPTSFGAIGLPNGLGVNPATGLISGVDLETSVNQSFEITASNAGGTGTATLMVTIVGAPPPPTITSPTTATGQVGVPFSYQITSADPDPPTGDDLPPIYSAQPLPGGLSLAQSSGLISGTPTQAGTFQINLGAAYLDGSATATLTLTIAPAPVTTPGITSVLTASATQGQAFSYQITADNAPASFNATGLPAGLSVDTASGLIAGTPTQTGAFPVVLSATNTAGTGTATLSLVVAASGGYSLPAFFTGEAALGSGVYYLSFPNGNYFGYYSFLSDPDYIYHFDLGYEYVFDAHDGQGGVYFYDFQSSDFFYTSPVFPFPYLYDFNLNSVLYYYPDPNDPGHYNTNGVRIFYVFSTGQNIIK